MRLLTFLTFTFYCLTSSNGHRLKRNVEYEVLSDSGQCVHGCWGKYSPASSQTSKDVQNFVSGVKNNKFPDPTARRARDANEPQPAALSQTADLYYSNCKNGKSLTDCLNACPDSKLKSLAIAENLQPDEYCLPDGDHFASFQDYYNNISCVQNAVKSDLGSVHCRNSYTVNNVTFLQFLHGGNDPAVIYYNADKERNNHNCRWLCQKFRYQFNCYKPILVGKCGQTAYDLYARITKIDARRSFAQLEVLKVVDSINECSEFQNY